MSSFNLSYDVAKANGFEELYNKVAQNEGNKNGVIDDKKELSIFVLRVREQFKGTDEEFNKMLSEKFGIRMSDSENVEIGSLTIEKKKEELDTVERIGYEITKLFRGEEAANSKYLNTITYFKMTAPVAEVIDVEG